MGAKARNESTSPWSAIAIPAAAIPTAMAPPSPAPARRSREAAEAVDRARPAAQVRAAAHSHHANAAAATSPPPASISRYMLLLWVRGSAATEVGDADLVPPTSAAGSA